MLLFTNQNAITAIKRQVYTGNKSTFTSVGTATGYLRPLTEEQSSLNGIQFGQGYQLVTEVGVDIRTGDKLTINSIDYTVRGVADHSRGGTMFSLTAHKKYLLTAPEL
jgi:hypothetical protein